MSSDPNDILRTDLLIQFLADRSPATRDGYLCDIRRVAETLERLNGRPATSNDVLALDSAALVAIVDEWRSANTAVSTIRRRLVSLRAHGRQLARGLKTSGAILTAQFPQLELPPPWLPPAPDLRDLQREIEASRDWVHSRDLAIMAFAAHLGLSTGEMARLNHSSMVNDHLFVERDRTGVRLVEIVPPAAEGLERYLQLAPKSVAPGDPLFLNQHGDRMSPRLLQMALRRVRQELGWPSDAVAGLFRRHRIRGLATQGKTVTEISTLMGIGIETVVHHLRA